MGSEFGSGRLLTTRHGDLRIARPYYYCSTCQRGIAPLDASLGLDRATATTTIQGWVADLAARLPFDKAAVVLFRLTQVSVSPASVERTAVAVGQSLRAQHQAHATRQHAGELPPLPPPSWALAAARAKSAPHSVQKRAWGDVSVPHWGQRGACAAPHSVQNFARSGSSQPQFGQPLERSGSAGSVIGVHLCHVSESPLKSCPPATNGSETPRTPARSSRW